MYRKEVSLMTGEGVVHHDTKVILPIIFELKNNLYLVLSLVNWKN